MCDPVTSEDLSWTYRRQIQCVLISLFCVAFFLTVTFYIMCEFPIGEFTKQPIENKRVGLLGNRARASCLTFVLLTQRHPVYKDMLKNLLSVHQS